MARQPLLFLEDAMPDAILEHVNFTVSDPAATADRLCALFGWTIRWQGSSIYGGRTVHVGGPSSYLALYAPKSPSREGANSYETRGGLNHVGVLVDDLDAVEQLVKQAGFAPHSHADYEPGRRFYFDDSDGIEFEVVSYA
jgi:glyoxylase I family protein